MSATFKCPICSQPVDEAMLDVKGSSFPFCSDRCRLIDLGRWLDGKYQIPVNNPGDDETDTPFDLGTTEEN